MMEIITKITGVLVNDAQRNLKQIDHSREVRDNNREQPILVREPANPYDGNAIRVEADGEYLGYIPQKIAKDLASRIDEGSEFVISHSWLNKSPRHEVIGMTVAINEVPHTATEGEHQGVWEFA